MECTGQLFREGPGDVLVVEAGKRGPVATEPPLAIGVDVANTQRALGELEAHRDHRIARIRYTQLLHGRYSFRPKTTSSVVWYSRSAPDRGSSSEQYDSPMFSITRGDPSSALYGTVETSAWG